MTPVAIVRITLACVLLVLAGCTQRPRAPVLDNNPLYVNKQEGFQFVVPEGWIQQQKTELPPRIDLSEKERTLVLYRAFNPTPASLEVSCRDVPQDVNMGEFLSNRKRSGSDWTPIATPESVEYGGKQGTRYFLKGKPGGKPTNCEIVTFRRGDRVYLFSGLYPAGDTVRRAQMREFFNGLKWTKD